MMYEGTLGTVLFITLSTLQIYGVHGVFCQLGKKREPTCVLAFEWQGCYKVKEKHLVNAFGYEELFHDNISRITRSNSSWSSWKTSIPGFACRCAQKVLELGLKVFATKLHFVCYGRKEGFEINHAIDEDRDCIRYNKSKPCYKSQSVCIGDKDSVSIYKIVEGNSSRIHIFNCEAAGSAEKKVVQKETRPCAATGKSCGPTPINYHSRFSKEESKKALLRLYGLLSETVDVDEILNLIKTVIKILKKPEIYQDLKVYKEMEEPFMDVLSRIVGDKYKEMWKKSKKIQRLVTLVEEVATTLLLSMEFAKETNTGYYYPTPNIDIVANFSKDEATTLNFNGTTTAFISKEPFGTAVILYKGIKDCFPSCKTQGKRSINTPEPPLMAVASPVITIVAMHGGKTINRVNGTIRFKIDEDGITHNNNSALDTLCVFWNENVNLTLGGAWSTNGLRLIDTYHNNHSNAMYYTCRTNHLTNFAILMEISEYRISPEDEFALGIITYVGCSISLLCLLVTIITLPFIRLREIHFKIHLNLCIALAAAQIIILSGLAAVQNKIACMFVAILLHYFYTVAFLWMLVEGVHLYQKIVIAYEVKKIKKQYYFVIAWGIPILIVGIAVAVHREGYGTKTGCWLSLEKGFRWLFIGPALFVMVVNVIILVRVLTVMVNLQNDPLQTEKYIKIRMAVKGVIILLPLLGLTWFFGLMSINAEAIVFKYIFSILNSLQGSFLFIFNYLLNKEVRSSFRRTLHRTTTTSL